MRLLLDTHIFIWWTQDDDRLRTEHREAISSPHNQVYVSAVTAWEIGIKRMTGKLAFSGSTVEAIRKHRFESLSISVDHVEQVSVVPLLHSDPFDRLLVAQAHLEGLTLVTVDQQLLEYQVPHL